VRVDHYVTAHDAGTILNPLIAHGQLMGSYSHGISEALYEEFVYGEDGSFKSGTFAEYVVPTACEVPEPIILHMETPSPLTPLGAKGLADGNCMSTPVCIANAVCDALDIENVRVPLHPSMISELIHGEEPPPTGRAQEEAQPATKESDDGALAGSGSAFVSAAPQEVWDALLDPVCLAAVIPGCHQLDQVAENDYRAEVSLGVGPVRGRFQARVTLSDLEPPSKATLSGGLDGPLGSSRGGGNVRLIAENGGTRVDYDYSVNISGKVAAVGGRLLEGAASLVVKQFFDRLSRQIDGQEVLGEQSLWQRILGWLGVGK
jgi:2-furoyl-CoA dehydrogenase large subunit